MKRMPLLLSLLGVIALSASIAYWVLQLYNPAQRPLAVPPSNSLVEPGPDAAAALFGGEVVTAVASNYQLTGVVASGREGAAILVADGQPPKAVRVGRELSPGVTLSEVHARYVMLSEGGVMKRIELATDATAGPDLSSPMPSAPPPMAGAQQPMMPAPQAMPARPMPPMPPQGQAPELAPAPMPQPDMAQQDVPPQEVPVQDPTGQDAQQQQLQQQQMQQQQMQQQLQQQKQQLPPGVQPSEQGVQMPMPNRNFMRTTPPIQNQ